ncbi:hypothetical protein F1737_00525 [Methanoplanus sp. FWC-SCC4]|uniref:Uncharacterized protein n=1 Tax=Methanochimaera problematica TaxID=2609417 RepID=A0AA97I259_9EURY|nr:hypothetical protein [Methanoplanus sp. FWC-SCC4]WOF15268.1 hypothetical protein F1737_00525 [Methanoplanus sp. FWC-SCC4]
MRKNILTLLILIALVFGLAVFSGCTESPSKPIDSTPYVTQTPEKTPEITLPPTPTETKWVVFREGSVTLNALGGYQSYSPGAHGERFTSLKVEIKANYPITVMFFNDAELKNFETKMSTNAGEYTPLARYDDVNFKVIEHYSDDPLNLVVWNPGDKLVTSDVNIWYAS